MSNGRPIWFPLRGFNLLADKGLPIILIKLHECIQYSCVAIQVLLQSPFTASSKVSTIQMKYANRLLTSSSVAIGHDVAMTNPHFAGRVAVEVVVWIIEIRLDEFVWVIRSPTTILVVPAIFCRSTCQEEVGPFKRQFRIVRGVLPAKVLNVAAMEDLALAIGSYQAKDEVCCVICFIRHDLLALYLLER